MRLFAPCQRKWHYFVTDVRWHCVGHYHRKRDAERAAAATTGGTTWTASWHNVGQSHCKVCTQTNCN